jgi:diaminopimelate epimerase
MADPFTLFAVAGGAKLLGGLMDTNAEVGQYKAQQKAEAENARALGLQADQAGAVTARNEEQQRREFRDYAGSAAAAAGEGALSYSGSLLDVYRQSEQRAELDALKIRHEGTSRSQSIRQEGRLAGMRSSLARQMAKRARVAGTIGMIGDAVGTASLMKSLPRKPG